MSTEHLPSRHYCEVSDFVGEVFVLLFGTYLSINTEIKYLVLDFEIFSGIFGVIQGKQMKLR